MTKLVDNILKRLRVALGLQIFLRLILEIHPLFQSIVQKVTVKLESRHIDDLAQVFKESCAQHSQSDREGLDYGRLTEVVSLTLLALGKLFRCQKSKLSVVKSLLIVCGFIGPTILARKLNVPPFVDENVMRVDIAHFF